MDWNEALSNRFFCHKLDRGQVVFFTVRESDILEISDEIGYNFADEDEALKQFIFDVMNSHPPTQIRGEERLYPFSNSFGDIFENGRLLANGHYKRIGSWWQRKSDGELCDDDDPNYGDEVKELFKKAPPFLSHLAIAIIAAGKYPSNVGFYERVGKLGEEFVEDWLYDSRNDKRITENWKEFCKTKIHTPENEVEFYLWRHLSQWGAENEFGRLVIVDVDPTAWSWGYVNTVKSQVLFSKEDLEVLAVIYGRRKWTKASRVITPADIIHEISSAPFRPSLVQKLKKRILNPPERAEVVEWVRKDIRHWDGKVPTTTTTSSQEEISIPNFSLEIGVSAPDNQVSDHYVMITNVGEDKSTNYDYLIINESNKYPIGSDLIPITAEVAKSIAKGADIFLLKEGDDDSKEEVKFDSNDLDRGGIHLGWLAEIGLWVTSNLDDNQEFLTLSDQNYLEGLEVIEQYNATNTEWDYAMIHKPEESLNEEQRREYGINDSPQDIDIPKLTKVGGVRSGAPKSYIPRSPPYLRKKRGNAENLVVRIDGGEPLDFDSRWNGFKIPQQTDGTTINVVASQRVEVDEGDDEFSIIESWELSFAHPLELWDSNLIPSASIKSHYCIDVSGARLFCVEPENKLSGDNSWVDSTVNEPFDKTETLMDNFKGIIHHNPETEIDYSGLSEKQITELSDARRAVQGGRPTPFNKATSTSTKGQNLDEQVPNNNSHNIPEEPVLTTENLVTRPNNNRHQIPDEPVLTTENLVTRPNNNRHQIPEDMCCFSCGTPCVGKEDTKFSCPKGCKKIIFRCHRCRNQACKYRCRNEACNFEGP